MNCNLHAEKVEGLSLFSLDFPLIFIILNCPTIRLTIEGHGQYLKSRYSGTCPEDELSKQWLPAVATILRAEAHSLAHSLPFVRLHWKVIAVSHQAGSHPDQTASLTPPPPLRIAGTSIKVIKARSLTQLQ